MSATSFVFLGLILLLTRASSELHMSKCCPLGQTFLIKNLSNRTLLECVSVPDAIEFYSYERNITMEVQGIPQCNESEDLTMSSYYHFTSLEIPACLETVYNPTTGENTEVVVHCRSNEDQTVNASSLQFLHIRKCCSHDEVFDSHTKTCVNQLSESENFGAFLLSRSTDAERIVLGISQNPLKCEGPIIDYKIDENDVFLNNTLTMMIPVIENNVIIGRKSVSDTACLEMTPNFASDRTLIVRVCENPKFCDTNACIRKCCPENAFFSRGTEGRPTTCFKLSTLNEPTNFYEALAIAVNQTHSIFDMTKSYGVLIGTPCEFIYAVNTRKKDAGRGHWLLTTLLTSDGHVFIDDNNPTNKLPGNWCQVGIKLTQSLITKAVPSAAAVWESGIFNKYCMEILYEKSDYLGFYLYMCPKKMVVVSIRWPAARIINCIFLLITLLVYAYLPSLRNIHGKTLTSYMISLILCFNVENINIMFSPTTEEQSTATCKVLAIIEYFLQVSVFFWLNVMCFDIWWTFGAIRQNRITLHSRKRFLFYCLYVWGSSFLWSIFPFIASSTDILPDYLKPNVAKWICFVTFRQSLLHNLIWNYVPVTILLISNIVFVVLAWISSNKVEAELKLLNQRDSTNSRNKQYRSNRERYVMNVKLFILTGVFLFFPLINFVLTQQLDDKHWAVQMMLYIYLVYDNTEGILIFILFVFKKRVYQEFCQRLALKLPKKDHSRSTTPNTTETF